MPFGYSKEEKLRFEMAPMIDIVFLLLIFFFCVSRFHEKESDETIQLAIAQSVKQLKIDNNTMLVNVRQDGTVVLSGQLLTDRDVVERFFRGFAAENV